MSENESAGRPENPETAEEGAPASVVSPSDRSPDKASAEAYAKDGIYGAPGSEVSGSAGVPENAGKPASQVEGERLGHEADAALQEADRERETPPGAAEARDSEDGEG